MNATPLFLTWIAFRLGAGPIWLYIPMIVVWAIGGDIIIIFYAHKICGLSIRMYLSKVVIPLIGVTIVMISCGVAPVLMLNSSFIRLIITCIATSIGMILSVWLIALTAEEKSQLAGFVKGLIIVNNRSR